MLDKKLYMWTVIIFKKKNDFSKENLKKMQENCLGRKTWISYGFDLNQSKIVYLLYIDQIWKKITIKKLRFVNDKFCIKLSKFAIRSREKTQINRQQKVKN